MAPELTWQKAPSFGFNTIYPTATSMFFWQIAYTGRIGKFPIGGGTNQILVGTFGENPPPKKELLFGQVFPDASHIWMLGRSTVAEETNKSFISRTNLSGSSMEENLVESKDELAKSQMVTDGTYGYWLHGSSENYSVARLNLSTLELDENWITGVGSNYAQGALAVDATYLYWPTPTGIARANKETKVVEATWVKWPVTAGGAERALSQRHYWIDGSFLWITTTAGGNRVYRVSLDGKHIALLPEPITPNATYAGSGIAHDGTYFYWVTENTKYVARWLLSEVETAANEAEEEIPPPEEEEEEEEKEKEPEVPEPEPKGGSLNETGVAIDFFAEYIEPDVDNQQLWMFVDPAAHSGYRLTLMPVSGVESKIWTMKLDRVVGGEVTELAKRGPFKVSEGWHHLELTATTLTVKGVLNHTVVLDAVDATYTKGRIGVEGVDAEGAPFGSKNFRWAGGVLDSFVRPEEDPLNNEGKWKKFSWDADSGKIFGTEFGWIPKSLTSGAYWTLAEYEVPEEPPPPSVGSYVQGLRDRPSLHLSILATTPSGYRQRWGQDDPNPIYAPKDISFSTTMPGGFERLNLTLQRNPRLSYPDLAELTDIKVMGPGGEIAWEGRLEKLPDTAGFQAQITPEGVGYQARLEDDASFREIYIDRDQTKWTAPTNARRIQLITKAKVIEYDPTSGLAEIQGPARSAVITALTGNWSKAAYSEAWYDGRGIPLGGFLFTWAIQEANMIGGSNLSLDENWGFLGYLLERDYEITPGEPGWYDACLNQRALATEKAEHQAYVIPSKTNRTWAMLQLGYSAVGAAGEGENYPVFWPYVAVIGQSFREQVGGIGNISFYPEGFTRPGELVATCDQIVNHALSTLPDINFTLSPEVGEPGTIFRGSFGIAHLVFTDPTTVSEVVKQAARFELPDWAIWEEKTFWMYSRPNSGDTPVPNASWRRWKTRVGPAQLQEAGPQISRLWNGVVVQYQNVAGQSAMVGPPGFNGGTNSTEDEGLLDSDPENPLNELEPPIRKWALLKMGTTTVEEAMQVGRIFLQEQKQLEQSGQATLVGHVEDETGTFWPAWMVRAGDQISFVDAADPSYRRIVSTTYTDSSKSNAVQLDQPPEGMQALLERLSASIVGTGLS